MEWMRALLCALGALSMFNSHAYADPTLEGIFEGALVLDSKPDWPLPLQFSLHFSEEIAVEETSSGPRESRVIDGSFSIDDEGGPFPFSKITYNVDTNTFDFRYSRDAITPEDRAPTGLRFTGSLNEDGSLSGRVVSGSFGKIGNFNLKRTDRSQIILKPKYFGTWVVAEDSPDKEKFVLKLEPSLGNFINPLNWELGFTNSKLGSMDIALDVPVGISRVNVDYLRQSMLLSSVTQGTVDMMLSCEILNIQQDMLCSVETIFRGHFADIKFKKIK